MSNEQVVRIYQHDKSTTIEEEQHIDFQKKQQEVNYKQILTIKTEFEEELNKVNQINQQLQENNKKIKQLENQKQETDATIIFFEQKIDDLNLQIKQLKRECENYGQKIERLKIMESNLIQDKQILEINKGLFQQKEESIDKEFNQKESEINVIEDSIEDDQMKIIQLTKYIQDLGCRLNKENSFIHQLEQDQLRILKLDNQPDYTLEVKQFNQNITLLQNQQVQFQQQKDQIHEKIDNFFQEANECQIDILQEEFNLAKHTNQLRIKKSQLQLLVKSFDLFQESIDAADQEVKSEQAQQNNYCLIIRDITQEIQKTNQKLNKYEDENSLKQQIEKSNFQYNQLQDSIKKQQNCIRDQSQLIEETAKQKVLLQYAVVLHTDQLNQQKMQVYSQKKSQKQQELEQQLKREQDLKEQLLQLNDSRDQIKIFISSIQNSLNQRNQIKEQLNLFEIELQQAEKKQNLHKIQFREQKIKKVQLLMRQFAISNQIQFIKKFIESLNQNNQVSFDKLVKHKSYLRDQQINVEHFSQTLNQKVSEIQIINAQLDQFHIQSQSYGQQLENQNQIKKVNKDVLEQEKQKHLALKFRAQEEFLSKQQEVIELEREINFKQLQISVIQQEQEKIMKKELNLSQLQEYEDQNKVFLQLLNQFQQNLQINNENQLIIEKEIDQLMDKANNKNEE